MGGHCGVAWLSLSGLPANLSIYIIAEPNSHFMMMTSTRGNLLATPPAGRWYTYDNDLGQILLYGDCASTCRRSRDSRSGRPGNLTLVCPPKRTKQWAVDGKPLYTFGQDKKTSCQLKGRRFQHVWHVVP